MIVDQLTGIGRYEALNPGFAKAFFFLRQTDLAEFLDGRHEIDGDRVYAIVVRDQGRARDAAKLEVHDRYIDIQLVLDGEDEMGWSPRADCAEPVAPMDPERDIQFFEDRPQVHVPVLPGQFAIFFPEDAHLPMISDGFIHKVIVKVAV